MRMRQIALVASDLAATTELFQSVLGLEVCHRDPAVGKWGLENVLMPLGHDFIEIVAPTEDNTTATRYLERRGGDGGYMVILQCEDGLEQRRRICAADVRIAHSHDRPPYHCTQYHPADVGATLLEIDSMDNAADHLAPDAPWAPAGENWLPHINSTRARRLLGVALQSADPVVTAKNWSRILDYPLSENDAGNQQIRLGDGTAVRFTPITDGRGDGLSELDIAVTDLQAILSAAKAQGLYARKSKIHLCGMTVNLLKDG